VSLRPAAAEGGFLGALVFDKSMDGPQGFVADRSLLVRWCGTRGRTCAS